MKTIGAAKFKKHCRRLLDEVDQEGIVITKRGKPVARLVAIGEHRRNADLIGILAGKVRVHEGDDLFSTGTWVWGERG